MHEIAVDSDAATKTCTIWPEHMQVATLSRYADRSIRQLKVDIATGGLPSYKIDSRRYVRRKDYDDWATGKAVPAVVNVLPLAGARQRMRASSRRDLPASRRLVRRSRASG